MVICLGRDEDLHMAQLIGFTFLVPTHPDSPGQRAIKWVLLLFAEWQISLIFTVALDVAAVCHK